MGSCKWGTHCPILPKREAGLQCSSWGLSGHTGGSVALSWNPGFPPEFSKYCSSVNGTQPQFVFSAVKCRKNKTDKGGCCVLVAFERLPLPTRCSGSERDLWSQSPAVPWLAALTPQLSESLGPACWERVEGDALLPGCRGTKPPEQRRVGELLVGGLWAHDPTCQARGDRAPSGPRPAGQPAGGSLGAAPRPRPAPAPRVAWAHPVPSWVLCLFFDEDLREDEIPRVAWTRPGIQ